MRPFTRLPARPMIVIGTLSEELTPYVKQLVDLMRKRADTVVVTPASDLGRPAWKTSDLLILTSDQHDLVGNMYEAAGAVLLSESTPSDLPDSWIVLPTRSSPTSVARIAVALAEHRMNRAFDSKARAKLALEAQAAITWRKAVETARLLDQGDSPQAWLRIARDVLQQGVPGITISAFVARTESGFCVYEQGETLARGLRSQIEAELASSPSSLINFPAASASVASHLREYGAELLIPFTGENRIIGWVLGSFDDMLEDTASRHLLENLSSLLQILIQRRDALQQRNFWQDAVQAALDEIDVGITILDKGGSVILENRTNRKIAGHLGCAVDGRSTSLHNALISARSGRKTIARVGDFTYEVSPWGALQNGCVLRSVCHPSAITGEEVLLKDWLEPFSRQALSAGLKLTLPGEVSENFSMDEPPAMQDITAALSDSAFLRDVTISCGESSGGWSLQLDQEYASIPSSPKPLTISRATVENAVIGRRISLNLRLRTALSSMMERTRPMLNTA